MKPLLAAAILCFSVLTTNALCQENSNLEKGKQLLAEKETDKALKYLLDAAIEDNETYAYYLIGMAYYWGDYGFEQNQNEAFIWFKKGAENNEPNSLMMRAYQYMKGINEDKNTNKALSLYLKSAEQGNIEALNALGVIYEQGTYTDQDYSKAAYYYNEATKQGHLYSMASLAWLYYLGEGVEQNHQKAFEYAHIAASQGIADGQYIIGAMYRNGHHVKQDNKQAAYWFSLCANDKPDCANKLGFLYLVSAKSPAACCAGWIAEIAKQSNEVYLVAEYTASEPPVVRHRLNMQNS